METNFILNCMTYIHKHVSVHFNGKHKQYYTNLKGNPYDNLSGTLNNATIFLGKQI